MCDNIYYGYHSAGQYIVLWKFLILKYCASIFIDDLGNNYVLPSYRGTYTR